MSCARALAYGGLPDYKDSIYLLGDNKVKGPSKADVFDRIVSAPLCLASRTHSQP